MKKVGIPAKDQTLVFAASAAFAVALALSALFALAGCASASPPGAPAGTPSSVAEAAGGPTTGAEAGTAGGATSVAEAGTAPTPASSVDVPLVVDFSPIAHLSQVYRSIRYDTLQDIYKSWDSYYDLLEVNDIEQTRNRYLIGTLAGQRRHEIVIRGTANVANALSDLAFARYWDPELSMYIHRGFDSMARVVKMDLSRRLQPGYELVVFGHSLGAAEAVIVGKLLAMDGWKIVALYASGQPRITDRAGCDKLASLPIVRIVNEGDPVPLAPPRSLYPEDPYVHHSPAIVLLDGPYYSVLSESASDEVLAADFRNSVKLGDLREDVDEHFISSYLARLLPKLAGATQVPFAERARYLKEPTAP